MAFNDLEILNRLWRHRDCAAGTFRNAHGTALAIIVVEAEAFAWAELDDRIVGADAVAVVALETVAAGQAAPRLE